MKVSSLAFTLLGSLLLVSGMPIPGEDDEPTGSQPSPPPVPAPKSVWGNLPASIKQPPPGPPVVARPIVPPSYVGHKDKDGDPVKPGDVKRLRSGSDSNPDGHPVVVTGTDPNAQQRIHALPMTHTPPQRWDQNHVKDASSYNVPGVDGSTKIYMKPKQVNPTNLEKWEYNNKDDHQVTPGDLSKLKDDMCTRANGGSCAYRPGAKKNDKTMVSKPKAAPKASGGLPVKGGIAKPAQKVGGARVPKKQSATSSKAPAKSTSGKNGQAKVSRKNVSGASVKGSKSSVKQSTRKTSSANNFAAKNTGKSSTKAPATQKSSITGKGGRTTAKSSGGKAKLAVKRPSTKAAVSQKQKTPAKSSSTRSKSTSKALGKANTNNKIPVSKQVSKKALVAKQATKAPTKARVTKQATKAPAKAANKVPAKAPSTKQAIKAPAQAAAKPAIKKGGK